MAVKFAATMNAINRGLESTKAEKGVDLIEDWETALADLDVPGAKGIARDLSSLRKQLERENPNQERVQSLLHRLGEATTKIAGRADKNGDKLKALGEALLDSGTEEKDEDEDLEAAKNPNRKSKK